jgi:hypothetical protein
MQLRADSSFLSNHFARILGRVTERERLAAVARAAGLRLTADDLATLLPAWKRYLGLVEALREAAARELTPS